MYDRLRSEVTALSALAGSTLRQLLRDPAMVLVFGGALVLIVAAPAYAVFHFDELGKVIIDTGLSTVLLAGLILALLGPARAVAYELEDRTALTLLSKPLGRLTVVCGKYAGVLAAAVAVMVPLTIAVMYVTRIEEAAAEWEELTISTAARGGLPLRIWALYAFGLGAPAAGVVAGLVLRRTRVLQRARLAAGYWVTLGVAVAGMAVVGPTEAWRWGVVGAAALIVMEVAVVAAVSLAAAVRLGPLGTMGVGLALVVAGHLRPLAKAGGAGLDAAGLLGWVPGLEVLNALEAAAAGAPVPALYVAWAGLYATMYAAAALLVGAALVHGREVA